MNNAGQFSLRLSSFAVITVFLVSLNHLLTTDRVSANQQQWQRQQLNQLLATLNYDRLLMIDAAANLPTSIDTISKSPTTKPQSTQIDKPILVYGAMAGDDIQALIFMITTDQGYNGKIRLLLSVKPDGEIIAIEILDHQETPGLGDKIERRKSNFLAQFNRKSLNPMAKAQWIIQPNSRRTVKEDKVRADKAEQSNNDGFDGITGATISARAVIKAIANGLKDYQRQRPSWLALIEAQLAAEINNRKTPPPVP